MRPLFTCIILLTSLFPLTLLATEIEGPTEVCQGECHTYSISNEAGGPYSWSVNGGLIDTYEGDSVIVCWDESEEEPSITVSDTSDESSFELGVSVLKSPEPFLNFSNFPTCPYTDYCEGFQELQCNGNQGTVVATNDCYQANIGEALVLTPLSNDFETLLDQYVPSNDPYQYSVSTYYNLELMSFSEPQFGTLTSGNSNNWIYNPIFCGTEILNYEVCVKKTVYSSNINCGTYSSVYLCCITSSIYINIACEVDELNLNNCRKVCPNTMATLQLIDETENTIDWEIDNSLEATIDNNEAVFNWPNSGGGNIQVTSLNPNGCSTTKNLCVEVAESPISAFSISNELNANISVCEGQSIDFINESIGAENYLWSFCELDISTEVNPNYTFENDGVYDISLIAFSECNCTDTTTIEINVIEGVVPEILCVGTICEGDTATYYSSIPCTNYDWSINEAGVIVEGGSSEDDYISIVWEQGPTGLVELNLEACSEECEMLTFEEIGIIPNSVFMDGPTEICCDTIYTYNAPYFESTSYLWQVQNGMILNGQGTHQVQVTCLETDNTQNNMNINLSYDNCFLNCSGESELSVQKLDYFQIEGLTNVCVGDMIELTSSSNSSGAAVLCHWNIILPDGSIIENFTNDTLINFNLEQQGNYTFEAVVTDTLNWCSDVVTKIVRTVEKPVNEIVGEQSICLEEEYIYELVTPASDGHIRWIYNTNNGGTYFSTDNPISITWEEEGPHSLAVIQKIAGTDCFSDTTYYDIAVQDFIDVDINGSTEVCKGELVTYSVDDLEGDFHWTVNYNYGDILSGQGSNEIEVLWENIGESNLEVFHCSLYETIVVDISGISPPNVLESTVCEGEFALITTEEQYENYEWKDENGITIGLEDTVYLAVGTYELFVTDEEGCGQNMPFIVDAYPTSPINITTPDDRGFCPPVEDRVLMAVATDGGYDYQWYRNDTLLEGETNAILNTIVYGDYYVQIIDGNNCTNTSNTVSLYSTCVVEGDPPPPPPPNCENCQPQEPDVCENCQAPSPSCSPDGVVSFDYNQLSCNTYELINTSTNDIEGTHIWKYRSILENTYSIQTGDIELSLLKPDFYELRLSAMFPDINGNGSCPLATNYELIEISAIADFGYDVSCEGSLTNFFDLSIYLPAYEITEWEWDFGDVGSGADNTSNQTNPSHNYEIAGSYEVSLKITLSNGCTQSISKTIEVETLPEISFSYNSESCSKLVEFSLDSNDDFTSIIWDFGANSSSSIDDSKNPNPYYNYSNNGLYDVIVSVVDINGCTNEYTQEVEVIANSFGTEGVEEVPNQTNCLGDSIILTAPLADSYIWSTGETSQFITIIADENMSYSNYYGVTVTDENNCTYVPNTVNVNVQQINTDIVAYPPYGYSPYYSSPIVFSSPYEMCEGEELILAANGYYSYEYEWSFENHTEKKLALTAANDWLIEAGTHEFTVSITNNECTEVSDPFTVIVYPPLSVSISALEEEPYCEGEAYTLMIDNPEEDVEYTWSTGENTHQITVLESGSYFVVATNSLGCEQTSNEIIIKPLVDKNLIPSGCYTRCNPDVICLPNSIINDMTLSYQWYHNDSLIPAPEGTVGELVVEEEGDYYLEIANEVGCVVISDLLNISFFEAQSDLTGGIFSDTNEDGIWDDTELGLAGVTLYVFSNSDTIATLVTDSLGNYAYSGLSAANYYLTINMEDLIIGSELTTSNYPTFSLSDCFDDQEIRWGVSECSTSFYEEVSALACPESTYNFDGQDLAIGTTTEFSYQNILGCDSIVAVTVGSAIVYNESHTYEVCEGSTYSYEGDELTIGSSTEYIYESELGCDSTVLIEVIGLVTYNESHTYEACEGSTYSYEGDELTVGSSTEYTYLSELGCDSTIVIDIVGLPTYNESHTYETCEGSNYSFEGNELIIGSSTEYTYASELGCDSTVLIEVIGLPTYNSSHTYKSCEGSTYSFEGDNLAIGSSTTYNYSSELGCDSIVVIDIIGLPTYNDSYTFEVCEGSTFSYEGEELAIGSSTQYTYNSELACDSTVVISIIGKQNYNQSFTYEVCEGSNYNYEGEELAIGSQNEYYYMAQNACDSMVVITIDPLMTHESTIDLFTCTGEQAMFDNTNLEIGSTIDFNYTNQLGCDSIIRVNVLEAQTYAEEIIEYACPNSSISFADTLLLEGTTTEFLYQTSLACDSIIIFTVESFTNSEIDINTSISCRDQSSASIEISYVSGLSPFQYSIDGEVYQLENNFDHLSAGNYTIYVKDAEGCINTFDTIIEESIPLEFEVSDYVLDCEGDYLTLELPFIDGYPNELSYNWQDGSVDNVLQVSEEGIYEVSISNSCETVTHNILVSRAVDNSENPFVVPTAFSPNNDGVNDLFRPILKPNMNVLEYDFQVYDRGGAKIYHSANPHEGWNGEHRGSRLDLGVYVWFYTATIESCGQEKDILGKGNITLIR